MAKADHELRLEALKLANDFEASPQDTVTRAAAYLAFLTGTAAVNVTQTPQPQPTSEPKADPTPAPQTTTTRPAAAGATTSDGNTGSAALGTAGAAGAGQGNDAGNGAAASGAAAPGADGGSAGDIAAFSVEALKAKCMALSGRDGPAALLAAFGNVGAGKWSEVPEARYQELFQNLVAAGV